MDTYNSKFKTGDFLVELGQNYLPFLINVQYIGNRIGLMESFNVCDEKCYMLEYYLLSSANEYRTSIKTCLLGD